MVEKLMIIILIITGALLVSRIVTVNKLKGYIKLTIERITKDND